MNLRKFIKKSSCNLNVLTLIGTIYLESNKVVERKILKMSSYETSVILIKNVTYLNTAVIESVIACNVAHPLFYLIFIELEATGCNYSNAG
jgi:hypothetical protein